MLENTRSYSSEERYKLIGKLIEEIKLRRYSFQTGKSYISIIKEFLASGKTPRGFLLSYTNKISKVKRFSSFSFSE